MKRIRTIEQLYGLAMQKKCVCTKWWKRMPAAWMINMSGTQLMHLFQQGVFEYKKNLDSK